MAQKKTQPVKTGKMVDMVSQDRNWVLRINGQLESQGKWSNQWGYLSKGFSPQKVQVKKSVEDQIQQIEKEVQQINAGSIYNTTSQTYGKTTKVELFDNTKFNIHENKDLRSMERKLPKDWKKPKWTPPVDPYDPLTNLNKKKK